MMYLISITNDLQKGKKKLYNVDEFLRMRKQNQQRCRDPSLQGEKKFPNPPKERKTETCFCGIFLLLPVVKADLT